MTTSPSVIIVMADGARPDTLAAAMQSGELPALERLCREGSLSTIATSFPSVTGPAYAPFLTGRHPGSVGLPGLRWYDRSHDVCGWPGHARSYTGPQCFFLDGDLSAGCDTMFELADTSLGALSVIRRGLARENRIGSGIGFVARTAITHFRGNVAGWLDVDRAIGDEFVTRVDRERPEFAFAAFTGIDKTSHAAGHDSALAHSSMKIVDDVCARLRDNAERSGAWDTTHLWVVSDHGHSPVGSHEDLASIVATAGFRTVAHPWIAKPRAQVAVAVSGNAMAHVYTGLADRTRRFWPALRERWGALGDTLLARASVDLMLLPQSPDSCEVHARGRGHARVSWGDSWYDYRPVTGDPLGAGERSCMSETEAFDATIATDYPDAIVQIARIASCERSGDIILSASPGWDFRARYEPIPHRSAHGALHRDHMLVPLITSKPIAGTPRRTVDVMVSACGVLGLAQGTAEGVSFM